MADTPCLNVAALCLLSGGCWGQAIGASWDAGHAIDLGAADGQGKPESKLAYVRQCPAGMAHVSGGPARGSESGTTVGSFCADILETTVAEYRECVKARRCTLPAKGDPVHWPCNYWQKGRDRDAIDCLTFWQVRNYCEFRFKRLPTPNEWKRAAGFGDDRAFPWGNEVLGAKDVCWMRTAKQGTCKVGTHLKDASPFGILDMAGNVPEWTADRMQECIDGRYYFGSCYQESRGDRWSHRPDKFFPTNFDFGRVDTINDPWMAGIRCVQPD